MKLYFTLLFIALSVTEIFSQSSKDPALSLTAVANSSKPSITLKWPADAASKYFAVYKKTPAAILWDSVTKVANTITSYEDLSVAIGKTYEYMVIKRTTGVEAVGYILSGINYSLPSNRGKLILLVDKNYTTPLSTDIAQLENDLRGDGWVVIRHDVNRTDAVTSVKQLILNDYNADKQNVKAVYILGHVPVPYSGGFFTTTNAPVYPPDGHPDHVGAWPCDLYYGMMKESIWTDADFTDTTGSRVQNRNKPGDGKFDPAYLYPDSVTLQVGRVDLFNMPAFITTDTFLVKRYLAKAHAFKMGINVGEKRGFVADNFGFMAGEAFASSGWRSMTPMFGDSITSLATNTFFSTLKTKSAQFVYGCGGGSYNSCGGIGATSNFVSDSTLFNFSMMFGSYFGDWDSQDNFLRAPLASKGWALSCSWSGRPYHFYHPMAMGENLGYCMLKSQNNYPTYTYNIYPTFIYNALMGDPSLRMNPVLPVSNVVLTRSTDKLKITVSWTKSNDPAVTGYAIYSSSSKNDPFVLTGTVAANVYTYTQNAPFNGLNYVMVKAIKPETTSSGTYINNSIGVMDTITAFYKTGIAAKVQDGFKLYPNPANNLINLSYEFGNGASYEVACFDINGKQVLNTSWINNSTMKQIDISNLTPGVYLLKIVSGNDIIHTEKVVKF